jgi:hypothetical protein
MLTDVQEGSIVQRNIPIYSGSTGWRSSSQSPQTKVKWARDLVLFALGGLVAWGISAYYDRKSAIAAQKQIDLLQTQNGALQDQGRSIRSLLVTAEDQGLVKLARDARGNITGGLIIQLHGNATEAADKSNGTGQMTTKRRNRHPSSARPASATVPKAP